MRLQHPHTTAAPDAISTVKRNRKYYTQIPNLVLEMGLTPYALSLYVVIARTAGARGLCYKSARTLARESGMSVGQVSKCKKELHARGLIVIHHHSGRRASDEITLVDLWQKNERFFSHRARASHADGRTARSRSPLLAAVGTDHLVIASDHPMTAHDHEMIASDHLVIERNNKKKKEHKKNNNNNSGVVETIETVTYLKRLGVSEGKSLALVAQYASERIHRHIDAYVEYRHEGSAKGPGWLIKAIEGDYGYAESAGWMSLEASRRYALKHKLTPRSKRDFEMRGSGPLMQLRPRRR